MRRYRLRNPTALEPSALETFNLSSPFRKPRQKRQDGAADSDINTRNALASAADSDIYTRNALASAASELPFDATQYLSTENRQLMEKATTSPQQSLTCGRYQSEKESAYATLGSNADVSDCLCRTNFDDEAQIDDQARRFASAQSSLQQTSMPFLDYLTPRPAEYSANYDPNIRPTDLISNDDHRPSNDDQRHVDNTLPVSTQVPATVLPYAELRFETIGPLDFEDEAARKARKGSKHHTHESDYRRRLTGFRGLSKNNRPDPASLDQDVEEYLRR